MEKSATQLLSEFGDTHGFFDGVNDAKRQDLARLAVRKNFTNRQTVVKLGDPVDGVYVLLEGAIRLERISADGDRFLIGDMFAGDIFGMLSVLDKQPSIHQASAVGVTRCVFIPAEKFRNFIYSDNTMMHRMIEAMCDRLRRSLIMTTRFAAGSQTVRVARCLLAMADYFNEQKEPDAPTSLTINQFDIASMLSVSRQSVNRVLKQLEASDIIEIGYNQIVVSDIDALREIK